MPYGRLSIVVCTFNRSDLLAGCLESLENQTLDPSRFEVLIVDNNSTDATKSVAERFCRNNRCFRYCFEAQQGLSHARNRGWQEASSECVGYIDDDAKAPPQWLEVAHRICTEARPEIFGGPYYAFWHGTKPKWFKDQYESDYLGPTARPLKDLEFLNGTNIFISRTLLSSLGGFSPELGMSGETTAYGEETALILRARKHFSNVRVYYHPELFVFHLVPEHKMILRRIARQRFINGRCSYQVFADARTYGPGGALVSLLKVVLLSVHFGIDLTKVLIRDRSLYPFPQNYVYERSFHILERIGGAYEELTCFINSKSGPT
jgi:glucosyl-dolichyl phosphate glucuronosyltransferase